MAAILEKWLALQLVQRTKRSWGLTVATLTQTTSNFTAAGRVASRQRVSVPARLTWKDANGAVRFASVTTRDLSASGAFVECPSQAPIPLFRLVHLQLEANGQSADALGGRVLAAVWRVEHAASGSGCPSGYALRFMIDPSQLGAQGARHAGVADMAVAS